MQALALQEKTSGPMHPSVAETLEDYAKLLRKVGMKRINWREVCKFGSGAAFVGTIANAYLWAYDISAPFPLSGYTIPPWLFGVRAIISALVFAVCVYVGYLRAPSRKPT